MDNIDDENEKESTLRYGDYITLRGLLTHGVLSAEGMLDVAVHMVSDPQRYDNCVFQVRNSNQYSASRELAEFHEQQEEARDAKATEGTSGDVEVSAKFRLALERGRDNEKKLNDSYFEQKKGAKIFYGDNVQLLHVNSGKYITVNSTQVAENERENLRVYLDPDGSQFSSLRVEPRYKIDRIGNPVLSDSQVFLRVAARVNEYLRVSDRDVAAKEREVNCSLERTPYKLCLYDDVSQTTEETAQVLSAGDIIYLQDPESDSQLRLLQDIEGERLVGGDIHAHEARDAYLDPNVEKGKINSNALFFVEKEDSSAGGKMVWREELYCLRHLNTGRYLSVRAAHVPVNSLADGDAFRSKNKVFARCISSYDQKKVEQGIPESTCMSTTFRFLPLYVQEGQENALEERFVTNNSAIQLENMNEDNGENNFMARGDRERVAENFLLRLPAHSERENSLSLLIMRVPHDIARDTLMGLSSKIRLRDFCKDLKTSNFGGIRRKVADTASTLTQVMAFVNQRPLTMTSYQLERLDMDGDLEQDEQRQILLQEQGVLDAILDVMQILGNAKAPTDVVLPLLECIDRRGKDRRQTRLVTPPELGIARSYSKANVSKVVPAVELDGSPQNPGKGGADGALISPREEADLKVPMDIVTKPPCVAAMLSEDGRCAMAMGLVVSVVDATRVLKPLTNGSLKSMSEKNSKREKIQSFLIAMLNLGSEMCLDRNYNSIRALYTLFGGGRTRSAFIKGQENLTEIQDSADECASSMPANQLEAYEALVAMLADVNLPNVLRASVVRLFINMFVDCAPQTSQHVPRLTRSWNDVEDQGKATSLPSVPAKRQHFFALVQAIISDHLHSLGGVLYYSVHLNPVNQMHVANKLLVFISYVTKEPASTRCITEMLGTNRELQESRVGRRGVATFVNMIRDSDMNSTLLNLLKSVCSCLGRGVDNNQGAVCQLLLEGAPELLIHVRMDKSGPRTPWALPGHSNLYTPGDHSLVAGYDLVDNGMPQVYLSWETQVPDLGCLALFNAQMTDTMVAMAEVMMCTYRMWRDYNLSKLMAGFKKWMSVNGEGKTPRAYFEEVISQGMIKMEQEQGDLDMVLLDLCMYDDQRVVQQALHCIANFSNMRVHLLRDFERVQLLTREKEMRQKQELELNVLTVRQLAETFELWEGLESAADVAKLSEMKEKLDAMIQACRVLNDKVGLYDGIYKADVHVQNMLTNLGLFEAAMTVLGLAAELDDEDAESEEKGGGGEEPSEGKISAAKEQAVMDILGLSCRLLCSWMYLNDQNQKIAFKELSTYFDLLDLGPEVGSARVITEIFRDNVDLIPQFPPPRIHDLVKKMAMQTMTASTENIEGKMRYPHPDLICIFDTITHSGMRGFLDNQLHVMKEFTRGETVASGLLFLGGTVDSEEYGYREKLCKEAELQQNTDAEDPDRENLPPDLIYNAALLDMLAGCAVGRVSITIIEVKLQTVYPCEDQLFALLSPRLPLAAKVPLANFFLQACIDVQISVPSLSTDVLLWRWLKSFPEQLNLARSVLQSICADLQATKGSSATTSGVKLNDRRQLQYAFLCLEVINYFMQREGRTIALSLALPDPDSWLSITKQKRDAAADPKRRAFLASAPQGIKPPATLGGIPEGVSLEADGELPPDVDMDDLEEDTATWMVTLMTEMYEATEALYDMDKSLKSGLLTVSQKRLLFQALDALGGTEARLGDRFSLRKEKTLANNASLEAEFSAQEEEQDQQTPDHVFSGISKFRDELSNDKQITEQGHMDNMAIREIIEFLPSLNDNIAPTDDLALLDLRYELLLRKLVEHASSTLSVIHEGSKKTVHADALETNIWMVKLFRNMIEAKWEMTIEDRDEDGGQAEDEKGGAVQLALNEAGVTALCLDMIAPGVDEALVMEAVKCLIALLFREGGNSVIQTTMNEHLSEGSSELFFVLCRSYIMRLKDYYKFVDEEFRMEGRLPEEDDIPDITLLLRLLQLMSEGHFLPNQDIMREQPHNRTNINLLEHMTAFVQLVSRFQCRVNSVGSTHMCSLILEVIQGPCKANQVYFALETELIETLNRMLRATPTRDCEDDHEDSLKELVLSIFQGLLEGQTQDTGSNVYDRVLSVLHFDVLHMLALGTANGADLDVLSPIFSMTTTQTESLVLMQMLLNYRPSLRDLLGPRRCAEMDDLLGKGVDVQDDVKPTVASVEVVWNGVLQRRFFHVPEICHDLSEASKAAFVEMVDRSSQESKLSDFIVQARDMYLEILHQQRLKSWHVARLFSRQNQNRSTWMGFLLCCTINSLLLTYESKGYCKEGKAGVRNGELPVMHSEIRNIDFAGYDHDHHSQIHCVYLSDEVENLKVFLNYAQIILSAFVLLLFLVVRVPLIFVSMQARGNSPPYSLARAFLDPLTVYYFWYQVMAVMAVYKSDLFSTFLLLDIIVKNSTTRAVVRAVYVPRKQLSMTMLLGVFVIYIFSAHNFFLFRDEFNHSHDGAMFDCQSMWRCLKSHLSYGLRMGGGIGDIMTHELDERILFDLGFFLVVLIVMMNIIFGIIIDTFSEIRGQKIERLKDTYERCFICGIEKQEFDRLSESGLTGFSDHYHTEHNMWHYFYFMVFIWEQDKDDDDGLEQYVRTNIDIGDISWFPIGKAIILTGLLNDENQDLLNAIFDNVKDMKSATNVQIAQLQNQMSRMQERIRQLGGMVLGSAAGKDGSDLIGAMQNLRKPQGGPGSIYASSIPHAS
eukprot:gene4572-5599_t